MAFDEIAWSEDLRNATASGRDAARQVRRKLENRGQPVAEMMACDDEVIPLQERIESVADEADLEDVYTTERHLLYVACTRARDQLFVSGVRPGSEFLDDMTAIE